MTDQSAYLDHTTIQPGDRLVINVREFGFEPTGLRHGDIVTVASVTPRGFAHGALVTVITPSGRPIALGYEWLDRPMSTPKEASMTHPTPFAVGDRVVVTDERTTVGTHPLGSGESQYVGQAATVIRVTDFDDYHIKFDDEDLSSMGSWSHAALDLLEDDDDEIDRLRANLEAEIANRNRLEADIDALKTENRALRGQSELLAVEAGELADATSDLREFEAVLGWLMEDITDGGRLAVEVFRKGYRAGKQD